MNITRNKKLIICGLVSASLIAGTALLVNKGAAFYTVEAGDAHTPSCIFNHYDKVDATYNKHGSKEFWACCNHPGKHLFAAPEVGTVVDKGQLDGLYFDELVLGDDRYIPSLYEDMDVLYDTKENFYVPQNYTPTYTHTVNQLDATYGSYVHYDIASSQDAHNPKENILWFKPDSNTPIDAKQYSAIIFYFKSNQTIDNLQIRKESYDVIVDSMKIEANTWTKIEVPVSEKTATLDDIGFASWGERKNLQWNVTSMYGVKKAINQETVFDVSNELNTYVPQNYSSPAGKMEISKKVDPTIGTYSCIDIKESNNQGILWFKARINDKDVAEDQRDSLVRAISLSKYSSVYFYIKSSVAIDNLEIKNDAWETGAYKGMKLAADTWTKIEINVDDIYSRLIDIAPASWGNDIPRTNIVWSIGSIYGILK